MFSITPKFLFLYVKNYIEPGLSHDLVQINGL